MTRSPVTAENKPIALSKNQAVDSSIHSTASKPRCPPDDTAHPDTDVLSALSTTRQSAPLHHSTASKRRCPPDDTAHPHTDVLSALSITKQSAQLHHSTASTPGRHPVPRRRLNDGAGLTTAPASQQRRLNNAVPSPADINTARSS